MSVPTAEFRAYQIGRLPRTGAVADGVSDSARAPRNRLARDELVAADAVARADELGIRVVRVGGSRDAAAVTALVEEHFADLL
ncbi:hypothetical protein [Micromonospora sp. NPDC050200]|uniref:hypothetical protein n=1 Tax=Micromonospora sp. NPDC050200 TaxID=3155664 RepID=UPI0033D264DE